MSNPSWHQWLSYETDMMDRAAITKLVIDSIERSIEVWEKHGVYSRREGAKERLRNVDASRWVVQEVDRIMKGHDEVQRESDLANLRKTLDGYEV
jgi:hypothetical protein